METFNNPTTAYDTLNYIADVCRVYVHPVWYSSYMALTLREIARAASEYPLTIADVKLGFLILGNATANTDDFATMRRRIFHELAVLLPGDQLGCARRLALVLRTVAHRFTANDYVHMIQEARELEAAEMPV